MFVASGCTCWNDQAKYPQTFGYSLDYVREGKILGQYVKQHFAGKKVAYFYQNDEFGLDGVKGLNDEIPASMVVSKQSYDPTNVNMAPLSPRCAHRRARSSSRSRSPPSPRCSS